MIYLYIDHQTGEVTKRRDWDHDFDFKHGTTIKITRLNSNPYLEVLNPQGAWKRIPLEPKDAV